MCKKLVFWGLAGLLGTVMVAGTGAWSYVKTGYRTASESVRNSVPVQFEIKRAKEMIKDLKPEIQHNMQIVAREEVEVQRLGQEIQSKEERLAKSRDEIMRLKDDLESGSVRFVYAGRSYSQDQVKEDLAHRFDQFKVFEKTTEALNKSLHARERNLDAARRKLDGMLSAKRELEVQVEELQARLTMVEAAQTHTSVNLDDSQLNAARQLLDEIRTRIDVEERVNASQGALEGTIQLDEPTNPELLDDIADYFGEGRAEVETLVSSQGL